MKLKVFPDGPNGNLGDEEGDSKFWRAFKTTKDRVVDGLEWYKGRLRTSLATQIVTIVSFFAVLLLIVGIVLVSAYSTANVQQPEVHNVGGIRVPHAITNRDRPVDRLTDPQTALTTNAIFSMPKMAYSPSFITMAVFSVLLVVSVLVSVCILVANRTADVLETASDTSTSVLESPYYYVSWALIVALITAAAHFGVQSHQRIQNYRHLQTELDKSDEVMRKALQCIRDSCDLCTFDDLFGDDFSADYSVEAVPLSKGNFGAVYRGKAIESGETVAVKRIPLFIESESHGKAVKGAMIRRTVEEAVLSSSVGRHENVLSIHKAYLIGPEIWLAMDFVDGEEVLWLVEAAYKRYRRDKASNVRCIPEPVIAYVLSQILHGLAHLHNHLVIHRDIKPNNWMYSQSGTLKVIDLGVAVKLSSRTEKIKENIGTWFYLSPEMVTGKPYSFAVDIWAVGVSALQMFRGAVPRSNLQGKQVLQDIADHPVPLFGADRVEVDAGMSPQLHHFITSCLTVDQDKRPSAKSMLEHPFLRRACDRPAFVEYVSTFK